MERPDYCQALRMVMFALLCFVIGFDAFLIKFRQVAQHFVVGKEGLTFERFYGSAMLLKQILGVMQLDWIINTRLYQFVFAGPNIKYTDEALIKLDVWKAWVARTIWDKYPKPIDAVCVLTTFSDEDF